ncbi:MAG TPA: ABC transporter permease [Candidatus Sulfotelmatobacter sp.]|nr:ABC transporter permease [Candidatus Sulfotelmatobacter sp.]
MTQPLLLEAGRAQRQYWRDLWQYRELFYFLAWRDILVRYKQTVIGVAWAVIRPLLTTIIFTIFAGKVAGLKSPGLVPHALFIMAAMLPWQFFATSMTEASNSLITNANLISKVYFPRLIVPAGSVITSFVDFLITVALTGLMMAWYRFIPDWHLIVLPLFMVLAFAASFGVGLWLCALNVEYRDFRYVVPFLVQFGMYVSPVIFGSSDIRHKLGETAFRFYALNPMVGIIDGFRWSLLRGQTELSLWDLVASLVVVLALISSGLWYFRRMERTFADVI